MGQDLEFDFSTCTATSKSKTLLPSNKDCTKHTQPSGSILPLG